MFILDRLGILVNPSILHHKYIDLLRVDPERRFARYPDA
jgi:hypothetical protein